MIEPTSITRWEIVRLRNSTGALADPDGGANPTITIYHNGALIAPAVTWLKLGTGVWRYSYTTPSTTGNVREYIDATIGGVAIASLSRAYRVVSFDVPGPFAGTGAHTVTVTVTNGSGGPALEGVTVRLVEGVNSYSLATNSLGKAVFFLNPATYAVYLYKAGFSFTSVPHQVTTSSSTHNPTFAMTQIVITPSADPALTTAYLTIRDSAGAVVPNQQVQFTLIDPADQAGTGYRRNVLTATSNGAGLVQIALIKASKYEIKIGGRLSSPGTFTTGSDATYAIPEQLGYKENA